MSDYCFPGHTAGSRPYVVPVAGNNDRPAPLFVVYHGRDYIDADGDVTRHPVRFEGYAAANLARQMHEARALMTEG